MPINRRVWLPSRWLALTSSSSLSCTLARTAQETQKETCLVSFSDRPLPVFINRLFVLRPYCSHRARRRPSVPGALDTLQRTHRLLPTLLEELEEYHASMALHYGAAVSVLV